MTTYLLRRLVHAISVVLVVSFLVFVLLHLGGDPAGMLLPMEATPEDLVRLREQLGLDRPLHEQYLRFLGRAVRGDFGYSFRQRRSSMDIVLERVPATLRLAGASLVVSLLISIPAGTIAALRHGTWVDRVAMLLALFGQSMPTFWLGIVLILVIAVKLRWLPASGGGDARHLVLPAVTLGAYMAALMARVLRSSLLEALSKDYVRTARAKGLSEQVILWRHVAKNVSIPVVTLIGLQIGSLMSGSIITETVFSYPGMGFLTIQAIRGQDFPVVQSFVVSFTTLIVALNLVVDLIYTRLDPRIGYR